MSLSRRRGEKGEADSFVGAANARPISNRVAAPESNRNSTDRETNSSKGRRRARRLPRGIPSSGQTIGRGFRQDVGAGINSFRTHSRFTICTHSKLTKSGPTVGGQVAENLRKSSKFQPHRRARVAAGTDRTLCPATPFTAAKSRCASHFGLEADFCAKSSC